MKTAATEAATSADTATPTTPPSDKPRLAARLATCIKLVHGIGKDGKNENQGYNFVREVDVMARVRGVLADNGVIVVPRVARVEFRSVPTKSGQASLTDVHMVFAVMTTDTDEVFECPWYGCGADTTDKGGNKAITSAEKYFLLKLLKIPTEADPDADAEDKVTVPKAREAKPTPEAPKPSALSNEEIASVHEAAKKAGYKSVKDLSPFLRNLCRVDKASDLSKNELKAVLDALGAMARNAEKVPA